MGYISFPASTSGADNPSAAPVGETTAIAEVPQFWQDYAAAQADNMSMLVIMLSLVIGLLLCLILKRR